MKYRYIKSACQLVALMLILPSCATAQQSEVPDSVQFRNDCRLAEQVLVLGEPANMRDWAVGFIGRCPEFPAAMVGAIEAMRPATVRMDEQEQIVFITVSTVDAGIFEAAMDVASDPSAGTIGRIQAIRIVWNMIKPHTPVLFDEFVDGEWHLHIGQPEGTTPITPLPADALERTVVQMTTIEESGAPQDLAFAARKVRRWAEDVIREIAVCGSLVGTQECIDLIDAATQP